MKLVFISHYKMRKTQFVVGLLALYVGLVQSWDFALSHGDLLEFYTNETKIDTVRIHSHNPAALAYDEVHNMLLYVDKQSGNDAICAHHISSKVNQCFIERNGRNIRGVSFDPATQLLFFSDTNERSINWFSLKSGSKNNVHGNLLIKMDHGIPTDIAVDSCRGYVYWINTNLNTPTIERARFNGSEREVIINIQSLSINSTYLLEPHSLTIDQQTRKMYWIQPSNRTNQRVLHADLNGKNETEYCLINDAIKFPNPSSSTLTVSKTSLFLVFWSAADIWAEKLGKNEYIEAEKKRIDLLIKNQIVGIAANYRIKERIQNIDNCEALTSLELNNCDLSFCVHGVKVIGQSLCKCTPGYIGDRCDVSACENYCFEGNCTLNNEGLPNCRCNAGYSGERCEVTACHGYCLNSGVCSLDEEDEPYCECVGGYQGPRCEDIQTVTFTFTNTPTYSEDTNRTLADLLAKWQKPEIIVFNDDLNEFV